jgi:hypothetical protein
MTLRTALYYAAPALLFAIAAVVFRSEGIWLASKVLAGLTLLCLFVLPFFHDTLFARKKDNS